MKSLVVCAIALCAVQSICPAIPSASASGSLRFDSDRPLTTLHGPRQQNRVTDLPMILAGLLVSDSSGRPLPFVLYLHGRGNEPKKSFEDAVTGTRHRLLAKIEQHGARALGVNWNSRVRLIPPWRLRCERPIEKAVDAAPVLHRVVMALDEHRQANPDVWAGRKSTLLAHSMGAFVLREAMKDPRFVLAIDRVFDLRLLTGTDIPARDHSWFSSATEGEAYVLTNPGDAVLARSESCDDGKSRRYRNSMASRETGPRLGVMRADDALATSIGITYIELPLGERHRTFTAGATAYNSYACNAVRALIRGETPRLNPSWRVGSANAYRLPAKSESGATCARGALPDSEDEDD